MAFLSVSQTVLLHFQGGCFKMAVYCPICYDWSIEVADFFLSYVGLFIIDIMLYRYIKFKKLCMFCFARNLKHYY